MWSPVYFLFLNVGIMGDPFDYCDGGKEISLRKRTKQVKTGIKAKEAVLSEHTKNFEALCEDADLINRSLYNQRAKFFHYQEDYEEAWIMYEQALQKCEEAGLSKVEILEIIQETSDKDNSSSTTSPISSPRSIMGGSASQTMEFLTLKVEDLMVKKVVDVEWSSQMRHACTLFNQKPKRCFDFLQEQSFIPDCGLGGEGEMGENGDKQLNKKDREKNQEREAALKKLHANCCSLFLFTYGRFLDQAQLGDYISERSDFICNIENVREQYIKLVSLSDLNVPEALRKLLSFFQLPE